MFALSNKVLQTNTTDIIIITLKRVIFCDDSLIAGKAREPCKACCLTYLLNGCH